jgi:hypothetical protein
MGEIEELLKEGGKIMITTPFARNSSTTWQRIYDAKSIETFSSGLYPEKIDIFGRDQLGLWKKSSISAFENRPTSQQGVMCLILRKGHGIL